MVAILCVLRFWWTLALQFPNSFDDDYLLLSMPTHSIRRKDERNSGRPMPVVVFASQLSLELAAF